MKHTRVRLILAGLACLSLVGCGELFGHSTDTRITCGDACGDFELPLQAPQEINAISYNVFLRPAPANALDVSRCRSERIGDWLLSQTDVDVVALEETFEPGAVSSLVGAAEAAFPFQVVSQPPPHNGFGTSGGLSVLSRWPIEEVRTMTYDTCQGLFSDCVAAKGAVHATLKVSEESRVNVVVTHLDAGRSQANRDVRAEQISQLRAFVDEIDPASGPILMLGDFNIDALAEDGEYDDLVANLDVGGDRPAPRPSTVNCTANILCENPTEPRRLDYVFSGFRDDRLFRFDTRHFPLADQGCPRARYLSDHRAVRATFDVDL